MIVISDIALKGGVGKTVTAVSVARILSNYYGKRVLLWDNDKQGNASKTFGVHSYDSKSAADILTARRLDPHEVIQKTAFERLDVVPANMNLIRANLEVMLDTTRPQQTRYAAALHPLQDEYDFCIFDNAPDINMSTINALVASDEVVIPVKIDEYATDGLAELVEQITETREDLNPRLRLAGCLVTNFQRTADEREGEAILREKSGYPVFKTRIRWSKMVGGSIRAHKPITDYSRGSAAAMDYIAFVREYLSDSDKRGGEKA